MLSTRDDRVLNAVTVSRILSRAKVQSTYKNIKSYYYDLKIGVNVIYLRIKNPYKNKLNDIVNDIENLFTTQVELNGTKVNVSKEPPLYSTYRSVLLLKHSNTSVRILFPILPNKIKKIRTPNSSRRSDLLRPGVPNEYLFESLINNSIEFVNDQVKDIRQLFPTEFNPKLTLLLYEEGSRIPIEIGPIKRAVQIGSNVSSSGKQIKPDIKIDTTTGSENISIKMDVFPEWSSAKLYTGANAVLDYLTNKSIIQLANDPTGRKYITYNSNSYTGIVVPATMGEVKKFCFNGDEVKYIIIKTFSSDDVISQVNQYTQNINIFSVEFKVKKVYENTPDGIRKLAPNVFLLIRASKETASTFRGQSNYSGLTVSFIPENKIARTYARISNIPINISNRL